MKRKKLVIISHTEHYRKNGAVVGWGATVGEINYLADFWTEVEHVACLYNEAAPENALPYTKDNIKFTALRPTGGNRFWQKLNIIWNLPATLLTVYRAIQGATEVQFRAPTGMGVYLLPAFSFLFPRRFTFWVKYAGNWRQQKAPRGYRFQRWWLLRNYANCKATINGFWTDQPENCLSFENPCLTAADIARGGVVQRAKSFKAPFRLVFVGRLEDEKGVVRIIESLRKIDLELIERMDFIGDGRKRREYEEKCSFAGVKVKFHGFLDNRSVHEILAGAHFFLLPSASEGFPKVIAEAGCYGCLPIVSNVGSIGHYINETNGFVWRAESGTDFSRELCRAFQCAPEKLEMKSKNIHKIANSFTFENYLNKLWSEVLEARTDIPLSGAGLSADNYYSPGRIQNNE